MGVALGGDGVAVSFNGGSSSVPRSGGEVVLDSFEPALGQIEVVAGGASLPAWRRLEAALSAGLAASGLDGACFSSPQRLTVLARACR